MKDILTKIVGCDTVSVRTFNIAQSFIILVTTFLLFVGYPVSIPLKLEEVAPLISISAMFAVATGVASFVLCERDIMKSRILGAISLIFGVIINTILGGNAYTNFPPFDALIVTTPLLVIWYSLAILFIFEVEGYDAYDTAGATNKE